MMTPKQVAEKIVKALDSKKARDIKLLKTDMLTVLADYFVICTATSTTQIKTLADEVDKVMSEAGEPPLRREGYRSGGWVLLDFGCVIVHLFMEEAREFYNLERLWSDAEEIDVSAVL
jgi:ribosome-associated protein